MGGWEALLGAPVVLRGEAGPGLVDALLHIVPAPPTCGSHADPRPRLRPTPSSLAPAGVTVHGGERAAAALGLPPAPSLHHEYSSLDVTLELVGSLEEAIQHIHAHGSGHTECIVTGGGGRAAGGAELQGGGRLAEEGGGADNGSVRRLRAVRVRCLDALLSPLPLPLTHFPATHPVQRTRQLQTSSCGG